MEELQRILDTALNKELDQIILSNTRDAGISTKAKIRPVEIAGVLMFQETRFQGTKVFHENFSKEEMAEKIIKDLQELYRQGEIKASGLEATILVSKKGKMTVKARKKQGSAPQGDLEEKLSHNRTKTYLLPEGEPVDFLVSLGVQTEDGQVVKKYYDKFRQINRYLEFIDDVLEELPKDRPIHVIDFGCGKSYLTFATYYFLHVKNGRDVRVTGLDLKEDVIRRCNELAKRLAYEHLHFEQGDIANFEGEGADLVISLHACDLATDYALEKAVKWGAKVILAVPCCQHELNRQIQNDVLRPALKYGIIKERMAALLTDAIRAEILERNGYGTQILEFIDMEHTPKNLLIRAVKRQKMQGRGAKEALRGMEEFLHVSPALERLLKEAPEQ